MKKVGIMTMQRVINYGSYLQAYGLKKIIEDIGYEVEFIDYKYEKSLVDEKITIKKIIHKIKKNINIIHWYKKKVFHKRFKEKYITEFLPIIGVTKKNYNKNIDSLVIGSDEVFNCMQTYPVGYSRNLFGKEYENVNVISYAASFGHTSLSNLKEHRIDKEIGEMLKRFTAISVRDQNSYEITSNLTNKNIELHLDPVLISDYSQVLTEIDEQNYIVVYAYTGRLTSKEEKFIRKFAKRHNKKIISLGFYQKIADKNLMVNPFAVLSFIKNADFVITDTFHGSVFSIKMNTKFCSIIRDSNRNKLEFLLKKLKQDSRIVNNIVEIEDLYNKDIDFTETNKILAKEKEKSIEYLKKYL